MNIYRYEAAFGGADKTTKAMRQAIAEWDTIYYQSNATEKSDPCQRIGYTIVNKLVRSIFGEYKAEARDKVVARWMRSLDAKKHMAMQRMLVGGECYIKPCIEGDSFGFTLIPRSNVLVFGRDADGAPTDIGTVERSTLGNDYFTLLERRRVEPDGNLVIENQLYRSKNVESLGAKVPLKEHPAYKDLAEVCAFPLNSVGLVRLKTPMLNCVDGSYDGVSVFAPAVGLIRNIDKNEAQLSGEFARGESRVILSADMLNREGVFEDHLFVGLDEDPEQVGITVFSPQLREQAFLNRKQEYLRNVESIIGLRRGTLSDANMEDRTATEITSSAGDYNLTVIDFQKVWEEAVQETVALCCALAQVYCLPLPQNPEVSIDWGNGVLYDEDKKWSDYKDMVARGILKPELALAWRFNLPCETQEECAYIRNRYLPEEKVESST